MISEQTKKALVFSSVINQIFPRICQAAEDHERGRMIDAISKDALGKAISANETPLVDALEKLEKLFPPKKRTPRKRRRFHDTKKFDRMRVKGR